ncbi:MAG TPA: MAPEG family protein [Paracoccaceae bacterium]|nr:MAPEG family protein [Paracoccaceae bacterium]
MTELVFWTALSGLLLSLAWLAYVLDRIVVWGLWPALQGPAESRPEQSAWALRHKRAHGVAVEMFVAWGPLAALAAIVAPEDPLPGTLAQIFFFGLLIHNVSYLLGVPVVRTLAFAAGALSSAALALRLIGAI